MLHILYNYTFSYFISSEFPQSLIFLCTNLLSAKTFCVGVDPLKKNLQEERMI